MSINPTVSDQIVHFALDTQRNAIPVTALQVLRLSLVDWMAVALAGADEPVANVTRALVTREGGAQQSYALGLSNRVPARAAALLNGASGHALDYDDTHFASLGHPSVAVLPAVLAAADMTNASADDIKDAALIGMETAVRVGIWLGRNHYRTGFHITATAGSFGAAMAVARLLGLNKQQSHHALSLTASRAAGVKAQFGSMGKPMHAGFAASNGIEAALLAELGFTAGPCAMESSQGFASAHHGENNRHAFDDLGSQFLFENVSHKFHACCHGTHAAMEAMLCIRHQHPDCADNITSIDITVHPQYLDICNIVSPATGLQAKFSYHMVAALVMNHHDTARLDTFNDAICTDRHLRKLHDSVTVHTDAALTETSANVAITTDNGSTWQHQHDLLEPMELSDREQRVRAKCASLLGHQSAEELWQQVAMGYVLPTHWMSHYTSSGASTVP